MDIPGLILLLLTIVLLGRSVFPAFNSNSGDRFLSKDNFSLSRLLLVTGSITGIIYIVFYSLLPWALSFHKSYPPEDFTPTVRAFIDQYDGIESFIIYALVLAGIAGTIMLTSFLLRWQAGHSAQRVLLIVCMALTASCFVNTGFSPPISYISTTSIAVPALLTMLAMLLYRLYDRYKIAVKVTLVLLFAFAALISIGPVSPIDLGFIVGPALRLKHGFKFQEVYFQYDLFLSLLALLYVKCGIALAWFAYSGPVSYFLLLITLFFFSGRFFMHRKLAIILALAVIVLRIYANEPNCDVYFQISPLRLDLWAILLLLVYRKGPYHWSVGLCVALLVLFHRNLGIIYLVAWLQLVLVLFLLAIADLHSAKNLSFSSFRALAMQHLRRSALNIGFAILAVALCFILFHEFFSAGVLTYREIGIGMLPIHKASFYWYALLLICATATLLFFFRSRLSAGYVATGIFIVLLALANSLYFFGRSHEQNILNISAVLTLLAFVFSDVLITLFPHKTWQVMFRNNINREYTPLAASNVYLLLPFLFLFSVGYYYAGNISGNVAIQSESLLQGKIATSVKVGAIDTAALKKLTRNSPNVYFLDLDYDVYYCHYGNYAPQGYYVPCAAWVFKKDQFALLQQLLNKGYYVVYRLNNTTIYNEYITSLDYDQVYHENGWAAIRREHPGNLLPDGPALLHTGPIKPGAEQVKLSLEKSFVADMIIRPMGTQSPDAVLLNNITSDSSFIKGISLQLNGDNIHSQYVLAMGNGTSSIPRVFFSLDDNKWNHLTIIIDSQTLKVYNNGKLLGIANTDGKPFVNSAKPMHIGSVEEQKNKFNGLIKEIRIINGTISDSTAANTGRQTDARMNSSK